MMQNDMKTIAKRTERYWFEDGIWEIGFGLVNFLLAGFFLLVDRIEPPAVVLLLVQMLVIVGAYVGMGRLVKLLKERITYPRTGYVAYRKPAPVARMKRILLTALLAMGMAALVAASAIIDIVQNSTALMAGILLAGALVYFGYRFSLNKMYLLAALTALLGLIFSLLALPDLLVTSAFFGSFGLLMALSGALTLLVYLSRTRPDTDANWEHEE